MSTHPGAGSSVCPFCRGGGDCGLCSGEGVVHSRKGAMGKRRVRGCRACEGTGECSLCRGEGFLPYSAGVLPWTGPSSEDRPPDGSGGITLRRPDPEPSWPPREVRSLVLRVLRRELEPEEACRACGIDPQQLADWTSRFLEGGDRALGVEPDPALELAEKVENLRAEVGRTIRRLERLDHHLAEDLVTLRRQLSERESPAPVLRLAGDDPENGDI